jgi:hypothetical protein
VEIFELVKVALDLGLAGLILLGLIVLWHQNLKERKEHQGELQVLGQRLDALSDARHKEILDLVTKYTELTGRVVHQLELQTGAITALRQSRTLPGSRRGGPE